MNLKNILNQLNIIKQCHEYRVKLWQCPHFLFLIMGLIIIFSMIGTYLIANVYYDEPQVAALVVIIVTIVLLIFGQLIINNFEYLAKTNQLKSEFISIASHQLRAPLANLKWALNFLMQDHHLELPREKQLEYLSLIEENNNRMTKLVNNLLNSSLADSHLMALNDHCGLLINDLLKEVVHSLKPVAEANHVAVHFNPSTDLPTLHGDPEKLKMAIQNIIDNAIKYTKENGHIWITTEKDEANKFVKITIKDNGVGIPKTQQKQIFQKFFRSDNVMKNQVMGTGLGLFIAKAIINAHHGQIKFYSEEHKGSIFWIILPIK